MKTRIILIAMLFALSIATMNCDRALSPVSPDESRSAQSGSAVLTGTILLTSGNTSFSAIQVGIKDTPLRAVPDGNGNFQIENLPSGNIVLEVNVQTQVSNFTIQDVTPQEMIQVRLEVQANNAAVLVDMKRNKHSSSSLQLEIQPKKWNVAWTESSEEVIAKISGEGFDTIDPSTVLMVGPEGQISPYTYEVGGVYFIAKFHQNLAITLISEPKSGDTCEIHITGQLGEGSSFDLMNEILIIGKKSGAGELALDIRPRKWNVAWTESTEEVIAKISGEGFDTIDPSTVLMVGPEGQISPYTYEVGGVYFIAKFHQNLAITLISEPKSGDTCKIHITGQLGDGSSFDLVNEISIIGKKEEVF